MCVPGRCGKLYCGEEIVRSGARTAYLPCRAFRQYSAALEQTLSSPTKLLYPPYIRRGMLCMVIWRWMGLPTRCRPPHCRIIFVNSQAGCVTDSQQVELSSAIQRVLVNFNKLVRVMFGRFFENAELYQIEHCNILATSYYKRRVLRTISASNSAQL